MKSSDFQKSKKIIYIICFLTFGVPFLFGYGIIPLTNFTAEIIAATGFGLLLLIAPKAREKTTKRRLLFLSTLPILILLASSILQYSTKGFNNTDAYFTVVSYMLLSISAIYFGHNIATQPDQSTWVHPVAATILFAGLIAAGGSIAQYLNIDGPAILLSPVSDSGRTFGFIRQPNHQGAFLSLALASCLFLHHVKSIRSIFFCIASVILLFALLTTGSRTALIQAVTIFILTFACSDERVRRTRSPVGFIALFTFLMWLALYWSASLGGFDFYGSQKLTQTASEGLGVRKILWLQTIQMISDCSWTGCGILRYPASYYLGGHSLQTGLVFSNAHNLILQLAFDHGVLLTATTIAIAAMCLIKANLKINSPHKLYAVTIILCISVHSMFEFPLWYTYFLVPASFFWGYLLRISASIQKTEKLDTKNNSHADIISITSGIVAIVICITMTQDYYKITPIYTPGPVSTLEQRIIDGQDVHWFKRFSFFPIFQKGTLLTAFPPTDLERAVELGCIMSEPWHQPNMIKILAEKDLTADAKWLLYLYRSMTHADLENFAMALQPIKNESAMELITYTKEVSNTPKSTLAFKKFCH